MATWRDACRPWLISPGMRLLALRLFGILVAMCVAAKAVVACLSWRQCGSLWVLVQSPLTPERPEKPSGSEPLGIWHFRDGPEAEPSFLEQVPLEAMVTNGSLPIHDAHVLGIPHSGAWACVIDSRMQVLMLRRAVSMKTCPDSWGLLGEHQLAGETPDALFRRALDEELGKQLQPFVKSVVKLAPNPVWYRRDYPDGRIDRQATWLCAILLTRPSDDLPIVPDHEVAELRWANVSVLLEWVKAAPEEFCHESIQELLALVVSLLSKAFGRAD